MTWFEDVFGKWVVRKRWWIICTTLFIVFIAASGVRLLTFSDDMRAFFSEDNPQLRALEALEDTYLRNEQVLVAIAPHDGNVFTHQALSAVKEITEKAWKMPYSSRVDSVTNFQHTRAEKDDLIVEDLVQDIKDLSREDLDRIKRIATSEPLLVNSLISTKGNVAGIRITVLLPGKSAGEKGEVAAYSRELIKEMRKKYPDIDLYLSGGVIFDYDMGVLSKNDMSTLIPLMFVVLLIIIGLSLRSFLGTFATFFIIAISTLTGMGLAGWLKIPITPASANAPIIILTLAIADSIHILSTIFYQMRLGMSKGDAIAESMRINLHPVFLTSATTAIGFLTMNFSDVPPFRDVGNIVAIGVIMAFIYSASFLPALMAVLPMRIRPQEKGGVCPGCDHLASFIINRRKFVWVSVLAVIFVLSVGIFRIELHDNWIKYFSEEYDIRKATDFLEENLSGFDWMEYSLESGEAGGINNPEYLKTVDEFAQWFRKQPKVVNVNVFTDIMKRLNKNMHGDDQAFYRIPEERDLAAQYLLLYEMSLPFGLDLNNQINVDKSSTRMIAILKQTTTNELREMDKNAQSWLKNNAPKEMFTSASGLSMIWAHLSERNIKSMLGASLGALVLISFILIFALRSIKFGLVSLAPNLMPALMAFGIWGLIVRQVGLGLSVVISLSLGIIVDDTIHFLSKYLRAKREHNMAPSEAIRYSFNTVGTAMWITSLALVIGFSVLLFSGFKMNSDMGLMTAITIAFALLMDFFFLPTLLMKVEK